VPRGDAGLHVSAVQRVDARVEGAIEPLGVGAAASGACKDRNANSARNAPASSLVVMAQSVSSWDHAAPLWHNRVLPATPKASLRGATNETPSG